MKCGLKEALLGLALAVCFTQSVNGQCTFVTTSNQYDPAGTAQSYTTAASCLAACSTDTACLGASLTLVGVVPFRCLFSTSAAPATLAANSQYTFNVPQHNPPSCVKVASQTPAPTPAPPATTPSPSPSTTPNPASPTPAPTPSPTCPRWDSFPNSNAAGGVATTSATTLQQCRDSCQNDPLCLALDYAPNDFISRCWRHYDATNVANFNNGLASGVTFERIDRVCTTPAPTPAPTPSPTPGPTPAPSTDCTGTVSTQLNSNANNGRAQPTLATQAECQQQCLNDVSCTAFDWAPSDGVSKCWFHTNQPVNQGTKPGITHYVITSRNCPQACVGTYLPGTINSGVQNVPQLTTATTLAACENACTLNADCQGVVFNSLNQCFVVTSAYVNFLQLGTVANSVYYPISTRVGDGCPATCNATYSQILNTNANGGTVDPTQATSAQCEALCTGASLCAGYAFNPLITNKCTWYTQAEVQTSNLNLFTAPGYTFHQQISRVGPSCPQACTGVYTTYQNTDGVGTPTPMPAAATIKACQDMCAASSSCNAYSYNALRATKCHHFSVFTVGPQGSAVGTTLGTLTQRVGSTCPKACTITYTSYPNTYIAGDLNATSNTRDKCLDTCGLLATCGGFTWVNNLCFLTGQVDPNPVSGQSTGSEYVLITGRIGTACPTKECEGTYTPHINSIINGGGNYNSTVTSKAACERVCTFDAGCAAYGWYGNNQCWTYPYTALPQLQEGNSPNNNVYTLTNRNGTKCPSACIAVWQPYTNTLVPNGMVNLTAVGLEACQKSCILNAECGGMALIGTACYWYKPILASSIAIGNSNGQTFYHLLSRNGTGCPFQCAGNWQTFANSVATGGVVNGTANTDAKCRDTCLRMTTCAGYGWTATGECHIHTAASLGTLQTGISAGNTVYQLLSRNGTDCPRAKCTGTWTTTLNTIGVNGKPLVANNVQECQDQCALNIKCAGISFNPIPAQKCLYYDSTQALTPGNAIGTTYYTLTGRNGTACPDDCSGYFEDQANARPLTGGIANVTATTERACSIGCLTNPQCLGYTWNPSVAPFCHYYTDAASVNNVTPNQIGYTFSKLINRTAECTKCSVAYFAYTNSAATGGTSATASTQEMCKSACDYNALCKAYGWYPTSTPNCVLYVNAVPAVSASVAGNTVNIVTSRSGDCTKCTASWTIRENLQGTGAKPQAASIATEADCQYVCAIEPNCVGYGWIPANPVKCYTYDNLNNLNAVSGLGGAHLGTAVSRNPLCNVCIASFVASQNTLANGGTPTASALTLEQCEVTCKEMASCLGYGWTATQTTKCWIHTSPISLAPGISPGNTFYTLQFKNSICSECNAKWQTSANTQASFGEELPNVLSDADCKKQCADNLKCIASGWTPTTGNKCWIFTNPASLTTLQVNLYPGSIFNQLLSRSEQCGACTGTYLPTENTRLLAAGVFTVANSKEDCEQKCFENGTCVAFQWSDTTRCFTFYSANDLTTATYSPGFTLYRVLTRSSNCLQCRATWSPIQNVQMSNGKAYNAATEKQCQDTCAGDSSCAAMSWAPLAATKCMHYPSISTLVGAAGVTLYTLTSRNSYCKLGCQGNYQPYINSQADNGLPNAAGTSDQKCSELCAASAICVGYGWTPTLTSKCWIYTSPTSLNTIVANFPGSTFYKLLNRTNCDICTGTWRNYTNSNVEGGTAYREATTMEQCRDQCLSGTAVANCLGYDYDPNSSLSKCWLVTDISRFNEGKTNGVTHYRLLSRTCGDTTTQSATSTATTADVTQSACVNEYTAYPEMNMNGGIADPSATTLEACQANCIANVRCIAIDFSPNNAVSRCWILETDTGRRASTGVTHYTLRRGNSGNCLTTTMLPSTTQEATTTAAGGCVERFEMFPNTNSLGGFGDANADTVEACQAACRAQSTCVGLDYDGGKASGSRCWLHLNAANLLNPNTNVAGVTQYRLIRCDTPTTVVATTTAGCQPSWTEILDKNADGGVGYAGISTITACQEKCISEASCVALDFDAANSAAQCWLHLDISNIASLKTAMGVRHHQLNRDCAATTTSSTCVPQWRISPNMHGDGAIAQPNLATKDACLEACAKDTTCYGADVDKNAVPSRRCWLYFNPITVEQLGAMSNVDNYIIVDRCPGPTTAACTPNYEVRPNSNAANGSPETQVNTVDACKAVCVAKADCVGFDYDNNLSANTRCWLHTNPAIRTNYNRNIPGVDNYFLIERCPSGTTASGCTPTWTPFVNQNVNDGTPDAAAATLAECQQKCHDNPACLGLDWAPSDTTSKCWYHFDAAKMASPNQGAVGVTLYRIDSRCGVTTSAPKLCYMLEYKDMNAGGGVAQGTMSESQCRDSCFWDPNCFASDFDLTTNICHHHPTVEGSQHNGCCNRFVYACSNACKDTYIELPGRRGQNGLPQVGVSTTAQCQTACSNIATCRGADFHLQQANPCRVYQSFVGGLVIDQNVNHLVKGNCYIPPPTTPATPTPSPTPRPGFCPADILFLVDSSGSIQDHAPKGQDNWLLVKEYLRDVIEPLDIGPNLHQVSLITFSNFAQLRFNLNSYSTKQNILDQIASLPYAAGYTNTPMAFSMAKTNVFVPQGGDRSNAANIIILLTDGEVTLGSKSQMNADVAYLKTQQNARIIGVGVSRWVNIQEVKDIVTDDTKLYNVSDFIGLQQQAATLRQAITDTANSVCTGLPITPAPGSPAPGPTTRNPGLGRRRRR